MNFTKKNLPIIILVVASFALHFSFLTYPAEVVFDEVHFGKFVSAYFSHEYYFDIHPPLGKIMIAGFAKTAGFEPGFDFSQIGKQSDAKNLLILRFLPALFGSLLPLVIYLLLKQMGFSVKTAFLGGFLTLADNALLVQSRFILLDIFLLLFGFLSLYFFLKAKQEKEFAKNLAFLATSAALAACSLSIKWTGLSFLGIIFLVFFINAAKKFWLQEFRLKAFCLQAVTLVAIPFIVYYLVFWIHFQILYKSGQGDAFMSAQFQKTLAPNASAALSDWQKFIELNEVMYQYNSGLTATHPYSSAWYQWPINSKPIWYWTSAQNETTANIYLFGNPIIWLMVLAGVIFAVLGIFIKKIRQKLPPVFWILVLGYFANLLPYMLISRIAFLYHYLPALVFGILIMAILHEKIIAPFLISETSKKAEMGLYCGFLSLCGLSFILLVPLNYGFFMRPQSWIGQFYNIFIKFLS